MQEPNIFSANPGFWLISHVSFLIEILMSHEVLATLIFSECEAFFSGELTILKSVRSSHSSQTTYQSIFIIPHVRDISEKFKHTGNRLNVWTRFKSKQSLHGTLMKTGPITEAKQMKQCVYNIPCEWQMLCW
jgi:hypothetical protein